MTCSCQTHVSDTTFIGHLSLKCQIKKIFVEFLTILVQFLHNFKKNKYINFLKTQTYCINYYYDYKNKKQILFEPIIKKYLSV